LGRFVAPRQQYDDPSAFSSTVHPQTGSDVQLQFKEAITERFVITKVSDRQTLDPAGNSYAKCQIQ
jgi:hypothetical protein